MNKKNVELTVVGPAGVTTLHLGVTTEPIVMAEMARLVQSITDVLVSKSLEAATSSGAELSCRDGCSHCCRELVAISAPEAYLLADHVIDREPTDRDEQIQRFERQVEKLDAANFTTTLRKIQHGNPSAYLRRVADDYFSLGVPCALLVDDSCSAYGARPIACRDHNVTSPADWCAPPRLKTIRRVPTPMAMAAPLSRMFADVTGREPELIPLPLAFEWVDDNAELGMKRWPGDELLRAFTAQLPKPAPLDEVEPASTA